jgi:hypothetical protein
MLSKNLFFSKRTDCLTQQRLAFEASETHGAFKAGGWKTHASSHHRPPGSIRTRIKLTYFTIRSFLSDFTPLTLRVI